MSDINEYRNLIDVKEYVKGLEDLEEATKRIISRLFAELDVTKTDGTLSEEARGAKSTFLEEQIRSHASKIVELRGKLSAIVNPA